MSERGPENDKDRLEQVEEEDLEESVGGITPWPPDETKSVGGVTPWPPDEEE